MSFLVSMATAATSLPYLDSFVVGRTKFWPYALNEVRLFSDFFSFPKFSCSCTLSRCASDNGLFLSFHRNKLSSNGYPLSTGLGSQVSCRSCSDRKSSVHRAFSADYPRREEFPAFQDSTGYLEALGAVLPAVKLTQAFRFYYNTTRSWLVQGAQKWIAITFFYVEFFVGVCMLFIVAWLLRFWMPEIKECWRALVRIRYYFALTILGTAVNLSLGILGTFHVCQEDLTE